MQSVMDELIRQNDQTQYEQPLIDINPRVKQLNIPSIKASNIGEECFLSDNELDISRIKEVTNQKKERQSTFWSKVKIVLIVIVVVFVILFVCIYLYKKKQTNKLKQIEQLQNKAKLLQKKVNLPTNSGLSRQDMLIGNDSSQLEQNVHQQIVNRNNSHQVDSSKLTKEQLESKAMEIASQLIDEEEVSYDLQSQQTVSNNVTSQQQTAIKAQIQQNTQLEPEIDILGDVPLIPPKSEHQTQSQIDNKTSKSGILKELTLPVIPENKLEHESDSDEPLINFKDNSLLVDIDDNESNKSVEM